MSVLVADAPAKPEQWYTLKDAAQKCLFPSAHALRMYLFRHPDIAAVRYRFVRKRYGKGNERILTETELVRLQAHLSRGPVKQ